ncbi:HSF-type DNA-binding [Seminavis robusta]|uniref:HSF-type DNA-binding n=1 Tax=Seminavis robusta TaxID=568900 RepID=A0A9N8D6L9_9STRA|nr:HSF-type DNA-binding [Seminavis robusta]|eukprot:Sro18_g012990.1 HSF-type DNA-binding (533) ;mRNA; r:115002-116788
MKRRAVGEADESQDKKPRARGPITGAEYQLDLNRFPDKIRCLLDNRVAPEALWWMPDGDAIAINKKLFIDQLLVTHFRGNKFPSITRKLNRWGFRRIEEDKEPPGAMAYAHELFHRNYPERLRLMIREEDKKRGHSTPSDVDDTAALLRQQREALAQTSSGTGLTSQGVLLGLDSSRRASLEGTIGLAGVQLQPNSLWAAGLAGHPQEPALVRSLQASSSVSSNSIQQQLLREVAARQSRPHGATVGAGSGNPTLVAPFHSSEASLLGSQQRSLQPQLSSASMSNNPQALSLAVANLPRTASLAEVSVQNQLAASILEERRLEDQLRQLRSRNDAAANRFLGRGGGQLDSMPNDALLRQMLDDGGSRGLLQGAMESPLDQLLAARQLTAAGNDSAAASAAARQNLSLEASLVDRERYLATRLGQNTASVPPAASRASSASPDGTVNQLLLLRHQEHLEQERLLQAQQRFLSQNANDPVLSRPQSLLDRAAIGDSLTSRFSVADQLRILQEQDRIRRENEEQKQGDRRHRRYP